MSTVHGDDTHDSDFATPGLADEASVSRSPTDPRGTPASSVDGGAPRRSAEGAAASPKKRRRKRKLSHTATAKKTGQLDIGAILSEPLHVSRAGKIVKLDPIEATVRAQVAKALKNNSMPAIKEIIALAIKHGLVAETRTYTGGVLVIPKSLPEETQKLIFDHLGPSTYQVVQFLEWYHGQTKKAGK